MIFFVQARVIKILVLLLLHLFQTLLVLLVAVAVAAVVVAVAAAKGAVTNEGSRAKMAEGSRAMLASATKLEEGNEAAVLRKRATPVKFDKVTTHQAPR